MRILMVISQFHPIIGGAERQALLLSTALRDKGVETTVVTGRWLRGLSRRQIIQKIQVVRNFCVWGISGPEWMRPISILVYMLTLLFYVLWHGREYNIIHIHQALYPAFMGVIASNLLRKPAVVKVGCSGQWGDVEMMRTGNIPFGRWMLKIIRNCERIVAINHGMKRELEDSGFMREKIVLIPNGVSIGKRRREREEASSGLTCLVYAGRLSTQKGIDVLFHAMKRLNDKKVLLNVFGDGPELRNLQELSLKLALHDRVRLCGVVSHISDSLTEGDIFILPSRSEGMSNSLLEAMSMGLPCIVTHIPGNIELVHSEAHTASPVRGHFKVGENGITVDVDDPEGLASAIEALVSQRSLRARLGQKAKQAIREGYAIDSIAGQYIQLYRSLSIPRES